MACPQSPGSSLYRYRPLVAFLCTCLLAPGSPAPASPTPTAFPAMHPTATQTSRMGPLRHPPTLGYTHTPQKDPRLTLGQVPMPKELLSAIWCRYRSVLEAEMGAGSGGHPALAARQAGGPHVPQAAPAAPAPPPEYSSLTALPRPFLSARKPWTKGSGAQILKAGSNSGSPASPLGEPAQG